MLEGDASMERFTEFPWGFFVVLCGFLIIFTIDKLAHAIEMSRTDTTRHAADDRSRIRDSPETTDITLVSIKDTSAPICPSGEAGRPPTSEEYFALQERNLTPLRGSKYTPELQMTNSKEHSVEMQLRVDRASNAALRKERTRGLEDSGLTLAHNHGHGVPSSLIFLLALGLHSLFEGAAIGLQTQQEKVLEFGIAVLVHELVMALTFGLEVSRSRRLSPLWQGLYVCLFTASIPLGIALGAGLLHTTQSETREVVAAVLEAVATGIFLHVIFIEILAKEFPDHHSPCHHLPHTNNNTKQPPANYSTINGACGKRDRAYKGASDSEDENSFGAALEEKHILREPLPGKRPSQVCVIVEKIVSICAGLLTLILMNVFLHSHH
ncbi:uncharacterized protein LOC108674462 isoform X2 [Hyalella azteca]|nr:uncharacterized protein LOC108674462 isoform X2 [Hyalella azteca]